MIRQRTIKNSVRIEGAGLQTGKIASLNLKSSPPNTGINFIRTDLANKPLLNIQSLSFDKPKAFSLEHRTTLGSGALQVQTTEHFLAALAGLSIDNIVVELDNEELPGLDGSAKEFLASLKRAGVAEQDAPKKILKIKEPVWCEGQESFIAAFPNDEFEISYTLSYKNPSIGNQFFSACIDEKVFTKEIAPARTFCLKEEAMMLLKLGFGKGASYENTLVMDKSGPVNNALRFPDEPVRHKVLDLIGDLYLLGVPIEGHVVCMKSGHKLNMELVKKLKTIT